MRSGYDAQGRVVLGRHETVGMDGGDGMAIRTRIHPGDPLRARAAIPQRTELRRGAWSVAVESEVEISCTREEFRVEARLAASEAGRPCSSATGTSASRAWGSSAFHGSLAAHRRLRLHGDPRSLVLDAVTPSIDDVSSSNEPGDRDDAHPAIPCDAPC